jgi:hypothetical protein
MDGRIGWMDGWIVFKAELVYPHNSLTEESLLVSISLVRILFLFFFLSSK